MRSYQSPPPLHAGLTPCARTHAPLPHLPGHACKQARQLEACFEDAPEDILDPQPGSLAFVLKSITAATSPSPPYAPYHDAYLAGLLTAVHAAPPGSAERHSRRAEVLRTALSAICRTGSGVTGGVKGLLREARGRLSMPEVGAVERALLARRCSR